VAEQVNIIVALKNVRQFVSDAQKAVEGDGSHR
jgi:hypothetical protein